MSETQTQVNEANPLLEEWTGPYGGLPPFDRIELRHFKPALHEGMESMMSEVLEIAGAAEPPTFENTIEALEGVGRRLDRTVALFRLWAANLTSPEFQSLERAMAPKLSAHFDRIRQNVPLFRRIEAVYRSPMEALTEEQRRLVWWYYTTHRHAGAELDDEGRARVAEINERLASLFTEFSANVLADEGRHYVVLEEASDLEGLPDSLRAGAAAAAEARGLPGRWAIENTRSFVEPFLTFSERRDLRERVWRMFVLRGDHDGEYDNKPIIVEILALRAERARLLGFPTHAHFRLEMAMAPSPEAALELMQAVWGPAVARMEQELAELGEGDPHLDIQPWDYRFHAEKVRRARFHLDQDEIRPYLQLDRLRDAMFWVAGELFGLSFHPVPDVPIFHPDVRVWEVRRGPEGAHVGLFYFDPFARPGKRSGAWMTSYRRQERFAGEVTPIVSNNSNFIPGKPGEPVLISWTDAVTLFHEFGHALNGLASNVEYPSLSGTADERDYVEFPSQLLEHWLSTPEVLGRFALHHGTGEPMPQDLMERIERAAKFNQGFATTEYLINALVDMELHLREEPPTDLNAYEKDALERFGVPDGIVMRHRLPHFSHAFSSDYYSASYYGYLWADVLASDAFEAFLEGSGPFDRNVAERLVEHVLSRGSSLEPMEGWRRFRGREPDPAALMRKRGLS